MYSIYFHDPNGIRLEIPAPIDPQWNRHEERARRHLAAWYAAKRAAQDSGADVAQAMVEFIARERGNSERSAE